MDATFLWGKDMNIVELVRKEKGQFGFRIFL